MYTRVGLFVLGERRKIYGINSIVSTKRTNDGCSVVLCVVLSEGGF